MNCEQVLHLISADIDAAITAEDRTVLEGHLAVCESCRTTAQAVRLQDASLRRAFAAHRASAVLVGDRVLAQLRSHTVARTLRFPWVPVLLSAAAGFLLALLVFRPWTPDPIVAVTPDSSAPTNSSSSLTQSNSDRQTSEEPGPSEATAEPRPRTHLVFATGAIEMRLPGTSAWQPMATGGAIEPGTWVRTGPSGRCEFRTPDGSEVRLNGNTELLFQTHRQLELAQGQVWSSVAEDDEPYQVSIPQAQAKVTALGTQFDIACGLFSTILTVVQGTTQVEGMAGHEVVQFGEQAEIVGGAIAERRRVHDLVVATSWVHEILVLKGHDNEELSRRLDDMLAQIGNAKMSFMIEKEILQLGDHCVLPLTRFIQSEQSRGDARKRADAARILAKIARPWSVEDLITLLGDSNREVRFHVAKALERLTDGETQGLSAEQWRDAGESTRTTGIERWRNWWGENKERFPTTPLSLEPITKDRPEDADLKRPTKS